MHIRRHISQRSGAISILLSFLILTNLQCSRPARSDADADKLFQDTEDAIRKFYLVPLDMPAANGMPRVVLGDLYRAALQAAGKNESTEKADRTELAALWKASPENEKGPFLNKSLRGFLSALPLGPNDPVDPESAALFNDPSRSAGVGILLRRDAPGKFFVLDVLEGSPSDTAQIPPGGYLESIDGQPVASMDDLEKVVGLIRGPAESTVNIGYQGKTYNLKRGSVSMINMLNSTWGREESGAVEYVLIRSTLPGTTKQLEQLLLKMGSRKGVILDLRKIISGDIEESFHVADLFLPEGRMGSVQTREGGERVFNSDGDRLFTGKIVVLLPEHVSPFASTLAMALKTSPQVTILGGDAGNNAFISKTVSVNGGYQLRLTTGMIVKANGEPLYRKGIQADIKVADYVPHPTHEEGPDPADPALKEAMRILK